MAEAAGKNEAKGAGGEDPSMEEILQSIRRIIAEDGDEAKPAAPEAEKPKAVAPNGAPDAGPAGSDVLELTEMIKEEPPAAPAAVVVEKPATPPAAPVVEAAAPPAGDVLSSIDAALAVAKPPVAAPVVPPAVAPATAAPAQPVSIPSDTLVSDQTAQAAISSLKKLKVEEPMPPITTTPSPGFSSGNTVEQMVLQMLMPMIKEWLDTNLPAVVERIVEREVRKLTRSS